VEPLQVLVEESAGDPIAMPAQLARLYGGELRLRPDLLYANMISSLDGVVALAGPPEALRGDCGADRLVMGLLRAAADVVVIGAGTLRASGRHRWTAAFVDPERKHLYAGWVRDPLVVVVSAGGDLDPSLPAFQEQALVLTTEAGAARLGSRLPGGARVIALGADLVSARQVLETVRAEGHRRILVEGGPTLLGHFLAEQLLEELFLTITPGIAGRRQGDGRLGLVDGVQFLPSRDRWGRLRSLRRQGSCLYARYAFEGPGRQPGA
jgi:riboflavin biosynthesis pyrimidine reductase